jgi:hypothetical protein
MRSRAMPNAPARFVSSLCWAETRESTVEFINSLFSFFFRALLLVVGVVFLLGMMALVSVFLLLAVLWSLLTGQKNPVNVVWSRARTTQQQVWRASRGGGFGARPTHHEEVVPEVPPQKLGDITDVQDVSDRHRP